MAPARSHGKERCNVACTISPRGYHGLAIHRESSFDFTIRIARNDALASDSAGVSSFLPREIIVHVDHVDRYSSVSFASNVICARINAKLSVYILSRPFTV